MFSKKSRGPKQAGTALTASTRFMRSLCAGARHNIVKEPDIAHHLSEDRL